MMRDAIRLLVLLILLPALAGAQETIPPPSPTPEAALGFRMGADNKLAKWEQVVDYIRLLDRFNNRVSIEEMGSSTQGRPMIAAIVSSEETIKNLDRYKALQRRLALPDEPAAEAIKDRDAVKESKTVVLVTCTIHSSETASTLMALELIHGLATADDPATKEILENTILVLVPSVNPDGVDIVADWYERSLGKPWEGSGLPRLYHPYAGHDTNRDWFMLNLKETQNLTRLLYQEWFPTITWDVHQMGSTGPRLFVPPFFDPINPNLDPRINQGIRLIGSHLTADLATEGKRGVATQVMYDNWWNGGNRTVPQRHNMVGILTEAASVRLASPIFLEPGDLRGGGRGFTDHKPSVDFVDPWPGGWWRLRDIVEYELVCARSLLTLAARYRGWFQKNYTSMAADAIEMGKNDPPYAWVVPIDQRDPGTAAEMLRILVDTGIRAYRAKEVFEAGGVKVEAGSWLLPADQPYRAHLKDMMERQVYPKRVGADGVPERPYDVAGWTLPLQMGVEAIEVARPLGRAVEALPVERVLVPTLPARPIPGPDKLAGYVLPMTTLADQTFLNRALAAGIEADRLGQSSGFGEALEADAGAVWLPATEKVRELYRATIDQPRFRPALSGVEGERPTGEGVGASPLPPPKIGVYQPWQPSMDEGWTRLVLEQFEFPFATLHNAEIRLGKLRENFDTIVLPSVGKSTLTDGFRPDQTEPDYVGGLGDEGLDALRQFVREGGTLVCLESSCEYAIDGLDLPVKNALKDLRSADFYCPGSILRIEFPPEGRSAGLSPGLPDQGAAYFAGSLAFEMEEKAEGVQVVARYAKRDVLLSGWLLGEEHLAGKGAVVAVKVGEGRVVLFGFPPQHRGQPRGTFGLLFQALRAPR